VCDHVAVLALAAVYVNSLNKILSSMLEINVYSIIDSKVFDVTVGDKKKFAIGVERFYDCKHMDEY
jgi:hypothetical protein